MYLVSLPFLTEIHKNEKKAYWMYIQRHDKSIRDFTSIADVKSNARHIHSIELFIKGKVNLPNIW